ncbi:MAG TPA: amino acid permease [Vicinamibacterales bacterium]|nr:amino acid permease [Vicinamibacterales bacterium]
MALLHTRPIDSREVTDAHGHGLQRVLGPTQLISLGIGAIIGTGIFVLTGQAAAAHAGPAIVLSMVIAGFASALAGLCYAEFAASVPRAGSAYTYAYATLGEFTAWIIGWDLILEYALGAATVAVGWSGTLSSLLGDFGLQFPARVSAAPGTIVTLANGSTVTALFNLPAMLIAAAVTWLLIRGVRESASVNTVMVFVKVAIILLVIATGLMFVRAENYTPFIPPNTGRFGEFGWSGIFRGAAVIFFAYIGFDAVSTAAQEARNPQRDMPRGILGSLAICTVLYLAVSAVMVGLVPYLQLGGPAPMAVAVDYARTASEGTAWHGIMKAMAGLIKVGVLAGLSSTIVVQMLAQPRIFMAMSEDGLLPAWAGRIHPRFHTPHVTTALTGVVVALAAGFTPISVLGQMVSIGTLLAFVIVSLGILVLRRSQPDLPRPFKTPWVPVVPIASAVVSALLMLSLPGQTWARLGIWMVIGVVLYFAYGARRAAARRQAPR